MESESDNRNCPESESDDGTSDSSALLLHILVTSTRQGPVGTLASPMATGVTEGGLLHILVTSTRQGRVGTLVSPMATGVTEARVLPSGEDISFQVIQATPCFTSEAKATQR